MVYICEYKRSLFDNWQITSRFVNAFAKWRCLPYMCLPSTLEKSIALILRRLKLLLYKHVATFVFLNGLPLLIHTISMVFYAILVIIIILFHFRLGKTNFLFRQHDLFLNFELLCELDLRLKRRATVSLFWWSCLINTFLWVVLLNLEILNCRLLIHLNRSVLLIQSCLLNQQNFAKNGWWLLPNFLCLCKRNLLWLKVSGQ